MATLLFYEEPVALNRESHKNLRLQRREGLEFASKVNSVPVAGMEFFEASRDLPVVFTKDTSGDYVPILLLSLKTQGHSLDNAWGEIYVPAFIRRYPFALSSDGTVIFDSKAPHLQEEEGDRLFNEEGGENTELLDSIIKFLNQMDKHYKATQEFCKACAERELFTPFKAQVAVEKDKPLRLDSLFILDEKQLNDMPDEQVIDWFRKGWLAWCYAHLHSLGAVRRLVKREREGSASNDEA